MKKVLYFAAVAALFAACSSDELADLNAVQQTADGTRVNFSIYTPRNTRAGLDSTITTQSLKLGKHKDAGFGVFAYYTDNKTYSVSATPNFMYNQQVKYNGTAWAYEPVKYWPNEFGNKAISDEVDRLSFFAYAPWVEVNPTNGKPIIKEALATKADTANFQQKNIVELISNTKSGDPIIKYVVDVNPKTSVDLLWGVRGEDTNSQNDDVSYWDPIDPNYKEAQYEVGLPFIDLIKPLKPLPTDTTLNFNLRHALSKVKFTIDYIADAPTPVGPSEVINAEETRIFLRNITINGFALQGALNLNNTEKDLPNWKSFTDGVSEITFGDNKFNDGRKDGFEGKTNGIQKEDNAYLNPVIVENDAEGAVALEGGKLKFTDAKNAGITKEKVLLFGGEPTDNDGFFYVIPGGDGTSQVDIKAEYDVETIDTMLASKLSDSQTPGLSTTNVIYKENVLKGCLVPDFQPGYQYEINIHIGMTSVKITATVTPWINATDPAVQVDLPDNQDGPVATDPAGNDDDYTAVPNYDTYTKGDVLNSNTPYYYKKGNEYKLCNGDNVEDWCSGADDNSPVNVQIYKKNEPQQGGQEPEPLEPGTGGNNPQPLEP